MGLTLNVHRTAENPRLINEHEIVVGVNFDAVGENIGQAGGQIQGGVKGDIAYAVGDVHGAAASVVRGLNRGLQVQGIVVENRDAGDGARRGVGQRQAG